MKESGGVLLLLRWDGARLRHCHGAIVAAIHVGRHCPDSFRAILPSKVIRLVGRRLEPALVEAEVVVFFSGVGTLGIWDAAADFIRVAKLVEGLVVGRLEVVIDHTTLLLFSERKVMAFQLGLQNAVVLFLGLRVSVILQHELVLGLGDRLFSLLRADFHTCCLHLGTNFASICGLSALLSLCID